MLVLQVEVVVVLLVEVLVEVVVVIEEVEVGGVEE
jgi:hypothetical protein